MWRWQFGTAVLETATNVVRHAYPAACGTLKLRLVAYTDAETYRDGGQGGFEIRTFIAVAGAAEGSTGEIWCYEPIPIFAVGCTVGVMRLMG